MNIGVDIDGVILDSERAMNFYADYFAHFELNKKRLRNDSVFVEKNFDFTKQETDLFFAKYFDFVTKTCGFVPGAREILKRLEDDGHKLFIISMRGFYHESEIEFCKPRLDELGVNFEKVLWAARDKSDACKKFNLDFLIEDNPEHIQKILTTTTKAIQLKDKTFDVPEVRGENVFVAHNWIEVYELIEQFSAKN